MLSESALYLSLAGIAVAMYIILLIVELVFPNFKKLRRIMLPLLLLFVVSIRIFVTNNIYIITDNNKWKKYYILLPIRIQTENGHFTSLTPTITWRTQYWIMNNGMQAAYFENVIYGDRRNKIERIKIESYQLLPIKEINYFFEPPPPQLDSLLPVRHVGWLYR